MPTRSEFDNAYMEMAVTWSKLSKAKRKKVGCIVVNEKTIISDGYNGMPSGFDNECEHMINSGGVGVMKTRPEVLHAESNAITKLAKSTRSSEGATLYITLSPCIECAKLIIQSGIKRVVYKEPYRDTSGLELLEKGGVYVDRLWY